MRYNNQTKGSLFPSLLDRVMDNLLNGDVAEGRFKRAFHGSSKVNVSENEDAFHIEIVAPGLKKEDFTIGLEERELQVAYEALNNESDEKSEPKTRYTRKEFDFQSFKRSFHMPDSADLEGIKAFYEAGILKIEVPKLGEKKNDTKRTISVG